MLQFSNSEDWFLGNISCSFEELLNILVGVRQRNEQNQLMLQELDLLYI